MLSSDGPSMGFYAQSLWKNFRSSGSSSLLLSVTFISFQLAEDARSTKMSVGIAFLRTVGSVPVRLWNFSAAS